MFTPMNKTLLLLALTIPAFAEAYDMPDASGKTYAPSDTTYEVFNPYLFFIVEYSILWYN